MATDEFSVAVVGIRYTNADGSSRAAEIELCTRGERLQLVAEPENPHDACAVAVRSARGGQIGYLAASRAAWISRRIRAGEPVAALFQELRETCAIVRVRFGGGAPALPVRSPLPAPRIQELRHYQGPPRDWYPDPEPAPWGA